MIFAVVDRLSLRLVPDELWALVEPLVPKFLPRPQGGGTAPLPDRAVFTAIVYVLSSGCSWRDLPPSFGVPFQTAHRRFGQWTKAGLWRSLHHAVLDELGSQGLLDWSRVIVDGACVRAKKGDL
jgi:transposase